MPIVVPVRFSGGGLAMQTTTSRMSLDTLFVRCLVTPKLGGEVSLQLTLPDEPQPVELKGAISETIGIGNKGKEAGFWVKFTPHPRLEAFLRRKAGLAPIAPVVQAEKPSETFPSVPPQQQTRVFPRLRSRLKVSWSTPREFLVAYSENISRGGIFVATPTPPALREVVELSLELPDGLAPAQTYAEVVQRVMPEQAKAKRCVAGAGLQFIGSNDEFRQRLDACLEHLLK